MILVIGDTILDCYVDCEIRDNPESDASCLTMMGEFKYSLGGAAGVANILTGLGVECKLVSWRGESHLEIIDDLTKDMECCWVRVNRTTIKTRFMVDGRQVLRFDRDNKTSEKRPHYLPDCDAIIVVDYGKGGISRELMADIHETHKPIIVSPAKHTDLSKYGKVDTIKMNEKEHQYHIENFGPCQQYCKTLIVTHGPKTVACLSEYTAFGVETVEVDNIVDVSGAGDTILAALGMIDKSVKERLEIGVQLAAQQIQVQGVQRVKLPSPPAGTIVFTNGVFDILHPGHLFLLKEAKSMGDKLIVAINSDDSVRRLKGYGRPVNDFKFRRMMLLGTKWVDEVIEFDELTPLRLINKLKPSVLVKAERIETIVGRSEVESYGGKVVSLPKLEDFSTTNVIGRVKSGRGF